MNFCGCSTLFRWCRGALEMSVLTRNDFGSEFAVFWCEDFRFCEPRFNFHLGRWRRRLRPTRTSYLSSIVVRWTAGKSHNLSVNRSSVSQHVRQSRRGRATCSEHRTSSCADHTTTYIEDAHRKCVRSIWQGYLRVP